MDDHSPPPTKHGKLSEDLMHVNKSDFGKKSTRQEEYSEQVEAKNIFGGDYNDEKEKIPASESSRRENILVMRLANKEQEVQGYIAQISQIKRTQEDTALLSLRRANLDPGVNLLFGKMCEELQQTKDKLEQAQSELSAWKFTPDSQNGKKLISRCRTLIAENQELGRQLSQGKSAQLEAELALQRKYSEELKASQDELNEFVIQLDEEVEGMQSTIQALQQQLATAKRECVEYKKVISTYESGVYRKNDFDPETNLSKGLTESEFCESEHLVSHKATADSGSEIERDPESGDIETPNDSHHHNVKHPRTIKHGASDYDRSSDVTIKNAYPDVGERTFGVQTEKYRKGDHVRNSDRPGTPVQRQSSEDSDSWSKDGTDGAWNDKTNIRCSDHSSEEDQRGELEVENEEIDSYDFDTSRESPHVITAHITSVSSPNHRRLLHSPHKYSEQRTKDIHENVSQPQNIPLDLKSNIMHKNAFLHSSHNGDDSIPHESATASSALTVHKKKLLTNFKKSSNRLHNAHNYEKNSALDQNLSQLQQDLTSRQNADQVGDVQPSSLTSLATTPFSNNRGVIQQNGVSDMSD